MLIHSQRRKMNTRISRLPQLRGKHALCVFTLDYIGGFFVASNVESNALAFEPAVFSEFKYGRKDAAKFYAVNVVETLMSQLQAMLDHDEPIVITGTPYKHVPNAARILAAETFRLLRKGRTSVSLASIYQPRLAAGDYGTLSCASRDVRNQSKTRHIHPQDFDGKHVILIDDIRITGSIERSTVMMLEALDVLSITTVNLVRFNQETALARPDLEDKLNHFKVQTLSDLRSVMAYPRDNFVLTTRAIKCILQADAAQLEKFLKCLNLQQLNELFSGIVDEGYDQMAVYQHSFEQVLDALHARPFR
jgi:orotate phosphoribosyltransferase